MRIVASFVFPLAIIAFVAIAIASSAEAGHRKPLRKGLKAAARLVLPCR